MVNGDKKPAQYYGSFTMSTDTIFLSFKGEQPPVCLYLIREVSGTYLVQFFLDGRKRIFLRWQVPSSMKW